MTQRHLKLRHHAKRRRTDRSSWLTKIENSSVGGRGFKEESRPSSILRTSENFAELRQRELRRIPLPGTSVNKLVDLAKPSGLDLVDEAAHALLVRDERARLDASDRLAHVLLQVREGLHGEVRLHANLFVDLGFELVV